MQALRRLPVILGCVMAPGLFGCAGGSRSAADCDSYRFSQTAWRTEAAYPRDTSVRDRRSEADWLVACRTLVGLTAPGVRQKLGRPTQALPGVRFYTVNGGEGFNAMDSQSLSLKLSDGEVVSASIR